MIILLLLDFGVIRTPRDNDGRTPLDLVILTGGNTPESISKEEQSLFGRYGYTVGSGHFG